MVKVEENEDKKEKLQFLNFVFFLQLERTLTLDFHLVSSNAKIGDEVPGP